MWHFTSRYYDGQHGKSHSVNIEALEDRLILTLLESEDKVIWLNLKTKITEPPIDGRSGFCLNEDYPNARLILDDDLYLYLKGKISRSFFENFYFQRKIYLLMVCLVLFPGVLFYGFSYAPVSIASYLPESAHDFLGNYSENQFLDYSEEEILEKDSLNKIVEHLGHSTGINRSFKIYLIDSNEPPNAFALANGKIFIYKSLVNSAASADELIGVIAHEMAHIAKHHSTIDVIRYLGLSLIVKLGLGVDQWDQIADLLSKPYSQELEMEADTVAADILLKSNVSLSGLKDFFLREKERDSDSVILRFFSTHPSSKDRINNLNSLTSVNTSKPILTDAEWEDLKEFCK